jgi:hypothetical protein
MFYPLARLHEAKVGMGPPSLTARGPLKLLILDKKIFSKLPGAIGAKFNVLMMFDGRWKGGQMIFDVPEVV